MNERVLLSVNTGAPGGGVEPVSVTAGAGCRRGCSFLLAAVVGCRVQKRGGEREKREQGEAENGGEGGRRWVGVSRLVGSVDGKRCYREYGVVAGAGDIVGGERSTNLCACAWISSHGGCNTEIRLVGEV